MTSDEEDEEEDEFSNKTAIVVEESYVYIVPSNVNGRENMVVYSGATVASSPTHCRKTRYMNVCAGVQNLKKTIKILEIRVNPMSKS